MSDEDDFDVEYEADIRRETEERERGTWRAILRERYHPWLELTHMPWGFRIGDGWRGLVEVLLFEITEITGGPRAVPNLRVIEVKEKFGQLRVYVLYGDLPEAQRLAVDAVARRAEEISATVCEVCGKPGRLVDSVGYRHAACPEHEDPERGY